MGTKTLRNVPPKFAKPSVQAAESVSSVGTNGHKPFRRRMLFLSCLPADQEPDNLRLSASLLVGDRLSVRVQRDPRGGVTEQFLHHLDICPSGAQQGRIRVAERMPS